MMNSNEEALTGEESQDPESMTFDQQEKALQKIYKAYYPWHGTAEARSYDYPPFMAAVREWSKDEFYRQHLLAKSYYETVTLIFEEPINGWQYKEG